MNDDHRHIRRHFDEVAGQYDRHAAVAAETAARLIERLDGLRFNPARILDLGCGTGQAARQLHRRYPDAPVLAIDASRGMLNRARRQRGRWRRRFELLAGDAAALPLSDDSIDLVFCSLVLEWCRDPEKVLSELRRILRPGGLMLIATTGPDTHRELKALMTNNPQALAGSHVIHAMRLGDLLVRTGFQEPVVDSDWLTTTHISRQGLINDLHHSGTRLVSGTAADHLDQAFPADGKNSDGFALTWEIVYASAWAPASGQPIRHEKTEVASVPIADIPIRRRGKDQG
ncbi:methyltransferase domain-containing protein [Wenzhouxiangella sp. AB-CW3]|uniref:methyltransferase domain-containing protein n=1 Tax=Wenzhouxiangella sp. AB-CW3 TaxID=2771012 RepID=UPI00168A5388|nr:methyltransferase domain-containing protein [Wenzhouxiangella sp. AB-CW3]QOC22899.1 methyltransferase domain-containing protein [Wenzhouxiangella sp. AB-CW3]